MLTKITVGECPHCGCNEVQDEGRRNKHVSGEWNEHRQFRCGYKVTYSPNFRREELAQDCPRSTEARLRKERRGMAHSKLTKLIPRLALDDADQARLVRDIQFLTY